MFETVDDIYNHIGQAMYNALPTEWEHARFDAILLDPEGAMQSRQTYNINQEEHHFNVNKIDGINKNANCGSAFYALYKLMQKDENDVPWNKARFEVTSDGDFEIFFKYDEDFAWYNNLDPDGKEMDELDVDIIDQIETWEGLPEDFPRCWRDNS
ncbi:MAG: DUF600 family protein [Colwellia sp.]|nr:DUF600 family protein [Colwellia sp.]